MCKEIIGYKLKKDCENLNKECQEITRYWFDFKSGKNLDNYHTRIMDNKYPTECYEKLEKAGVLKLWFEPIYEEEEFKVGDWVKHIGGSSTICKNGYIYKLEDIDSYGWVYHICDDGSRNGYNKKHYKLATKQEIEQHLIAEAKRRGLKEGVKYKYPHRPHINIRECFYKFYTNSSNDLCDGEKGNGNIIFNNLDNTWAEIIKDEEIEISGYKAEFDKVRKTVQFGCKTVTLEELKAVLVVMELNAKFKYQFIIAENEIFTTRNESSFGELENGVTKETIKKLIKILEDE